MFKHVDSMTKEVKTDNIFEENSENNAKLQKIFRPNWVNIKC